MKQVENRKIVIIFFLIFFIFEQLLKELDQVAGNSGQQLIQSLRASDNIQIIYGRIIIS